MNIPLRVRLILSHGAIVLIFSAVSIAVYSLLKSLAENKEWTVHTYNVLRETDDALLALLNMETGIRGYLITGQNSFLEPYHDGKSAFQKHVKQLASLTSDNQQQQVRISKLVDQYNRGSATYVNNQLALRESVNSGATASSQIALQEARATGKAAMDQMRAIISDITAEERVLLDQRYGDMNQSLSLSEQSMLYGVIISALFGLTIATLISRSLTQSLGAEPYQVKAVTDAIAGGDLTTDIPVKHHDQASIIFSIREMRDELKRLVLDVQDNAAHLQQRSAMLTEAAKGITIATDEQSCSTGSMAASLEELSVSISTVSDSANDALECSHQLSDASQLSDQIIRNSQQEMDTISNLVSETENAVSRMSESSEKISNIIEVIREVTEQTNLLALNAAIEAARAGEMGRGFSVVADEVRKLAEKTTDSANDIAQMIHVVRNHTNAAVNSMKAVVTSVHNGRTLSQNASDTMATMRQHVQVVTDSINHISIALNEQSQASITISQSVENIAQMTEETAATVKSTDDTANQLYTLANQLTGKVSHFVTS